MQEIEMLKIPRDQIIQIYTESSEKTIEFMIQNEEKGESNVDIIEKFKTISTQLITEKLSSIEESFAAKTEEEKQKHIEYNRKQLMEFQHETD